MRTDGIAKLSLRTRLAILSVVLIVPLTAITIFLLFTLNDICDSYDVIVRNVTSASGYSTAFKEEIDSALYQMVARNLNKDEVEAIGMENPDRTLSEARATFMRLQGSSGSKDAIEQCRGIINLLDTLSLRIDDIDGRVKISGSYDENMLSLDNDIRILTELIQEKISGYIFYESADMEKMRIDMDTRRDEILKMSVIVIILLLIATILISVEITRSITRPVEQLVRATEAIGAGDFSVRTEGNAGSEIASLNDSFNRMAEQIADLVEHVKREDSRLRELELRLLQEQINPHFLYNTLDNILWLAEDERKEDIEAIVTSLSRFFRTALSGGRDTIRIEEEISHIRSYLEIQQFRYRDILTYEIEIPSEYYDYEILRMTLQPIVENALYHGIKNKRGMGRIKVSMRKEDEDLILVVSDDGIGMTDDEVGHIERLCSGEEAVSESGSGFGLANVAERLRLRYGEAYGLRIYSTFGEGTDVEIIIPCTEAVTEAAAEKI